MTDLDISVIIVGLNARDYVIDCLASLQKTSWAGYSSEVIYVDNGSEDQSAETVRRLFPEVRVIANSKNIGFCRAVNQGSKAGRGRYLYHLNDDTILMEDTIPRLAKFLDETPEAGAAGNRLLNPDGTDQWSARRFPNWYNGFLGRKTLFGRLFPSSKILRHYLYKDEMECGIPFEVDWVPGSCTLVRREVHEEIGGLPENLHYWSDAVYCRRIRQNGWQIFLLPDARLIHYEGKGSGKRTPQAERWHIREFHRSAFRFYCEHYRLGPHHPLRWMARSALAARAFLLLALNRLSVIRN